ncbi:3-oxoacyl-ACP reductase FabG [Staphylococcus pasteuri]|uniref:3-oxoacyl-ACP reductase FabG n=1 Tax=Staphylococcus pasteuri TaxID=45972 RepID=UPI003D089280
MEIALVTGGVKGIGKSVSIKLQEKGYKVYATYNKSINKANELESKYLNIKTIQLDITDNKEVQNVIKKIYTLEGKIDCLVNNAGTINDGYFLMMSNNKWNNVINTNLNGTFNVLKTTLKYMKVKKSGRVVNISSTSGVSGQVGQANYSASKGAIITLTKTLAKELAGDNIRINSVSPGFIETEMTSKLPNKEILKEEYIPMKRFGKTEEVANVVEFLLSENSSYITGKNISIDGGMIHD